MSMLLLRSMAASQATPSRRSKALLLVSSNTLPEVRM